jgi:DNA repair protein RadC
MESIKIKDLPQNERPTERLLRYGAENLSNSELLAVILRTGTAKENVLNLCSKILSEKGSLNALLNSGLNEFVSINGIGKVKASQLLALAEISKRFKGYRDGEDFKITRPKDGADCVMESMRHLKQEILKVIMLNTKNVVIHIMDVSKGSLNSSIVHPREVFSGAVKYSSASIILCHNHPSGDPTPSSEDISITHRIKECGKIMGIELLDHIIIGNGN